MSKSRVKRSYDSFYGDGESTMMINSPHCSPLRPMQQQQQQLQPVSEEQQLPQPFTLNTANMTDASQLPSDISSSSSTGFSFGFSPTPTPNFSSLYSSSTTNPFANLATASPAQIHTPAFSSPSASSTSSSSVALPPNPSYASPPASSYKRFRRTGQADVSMSDEQDSTAASSTTANGTDSTGHQSPFARLKRPALDELMFVPRHFKKQAIAAALAGPSTTAQVHPRPVAAPNSPNTNSTVAACIPPPPSSTGSSLPSYHNQLFTYEQVASIVRNALEMREEQIREEYNRTLQELLREQFENFSMFNRDYISRNMKQLDTNDDYENSYYS